MCSVVHHYTKATSKRKGLVGERERKKGRVRGKLMSKKCPNGKEAVNKSSIKFKRHIWDPYDEAQVINYLRGHFVRA